MNRSIRHLVACFLLLCMAATVVPVNLFHHHDEAPHKAAHHHPDILLNTVDGYAGDVLQAPAEEQTSISEVHEVCELCQLLTLQRLQYTTHQFNDVPQPAEAVAEVAYEEVNLVHQNQLVSSGRAPPVC